MGPGLSRVWVSPVVAGETWGESVYRECTESVPTGANPVRVGGTRCNMGTHRKRGHSVENATKSECLQGGLEWRVLQVVPGSNPSATATGSPLVPTESWSRGACLCAWVYRECAGGPLPLCRGELGLDPANEVPPSLMVHTFLTPSAFWALPLPGAPSCRGLASGWDGLPRVGW